MQKKKIFIEIEIPSQIKRRLAQKIAPWSELPIKWMKEENLHLTVAFIGYVDESVVPEICAKVAAAVSQLEIFDLEFDRIELGPDPENPRLLWLTGKPLVELGKLNEVVEEALGMRPEKHGEYSPHLTLGRIRKLKWDELPEKPQINEKIQLAMSVEYVSVMESKGGGDEYVALEQCPLG